MPNTAETSDLALEFWDYAVALYVRPGVQEQLLHWQDKNCADVNLALLCVWAGSRGRALENADFRLASAATTGWNAGVTRTLRALRRRLKEDWHCLAENTEPARQSILAAELEAERTAQRLMLEALAPWPAAPAGGSPALAEANLRAYLGAAATAAPASIIAAICSAE